jgi:hypothetical protein
MNDESLINLNNIDRITSKKSKRVLKNKDSKTEKKPVNLQLSQLVLSPSKVINEEKENREANGETNVKTKPILD